MIPDNLREIMIHNASELENDLHKDHEPVVKLFSKYGKPIWLLSELDPENDIAFGLCDLGNGKPELGYVSIAHLESIKHAKLKVPMVEYDPEFIGKFPMSIYLKAALRQGRVTFDQQILKEVLQ